MKRPVIWLAFPVIVMCIAGSIERAGFFLVFLTLILFALFYFFYIKNKRVLFSYICFLIFSFFVIINNFSVPNAINHMNASGENLEVNGVGRVERSTGKDEYMSVHLKNVLIVKDGVKDNIGGVLLYCEPCDIKSGDLIGFTGKLKPLEGARMQGCFDEKNYYESINIFSKCNADNISVISHDANPVTVIANSVKDYLYKSYQKISPDYAGRLSAITLGDQSLLEDDIKEAYRKNGIGHLLAISGLHISIVGMLIYKLLRKLGCAFVPSVICGTSLIMIYTTMTGFSVSAIRAAVMFSLAVIADIPGRSYDPLSSLSLQCVITLLINPYSIRGPSFIMSYVSVFSIIIFGSVGRPIADICKKKFFVKYVFSDLGVSVAVFFGLLPVNLYFYNEAPLYSVLVNIIIIPLSGVLIGSAFIAGAVGGVSVWGGRFLIALSERIFDLYDYVCEFFSDVFGGLTLTGSPGIFKIIIYYLVFFAVFILLRKRVVSEMELAYKTERLTLRSDIRKTINKIKMPVILAVVFCLAGFVVISIKGKEAFYCTMLDVGQGDSIFIHTDSGRNFLFDSGSGNIKNVYSKRVESFLKAKGIKKIDAVFISHSDADHINAVQDMVEKGNIKISNIVMPDIDDDLKNEGYKNLTYSAKEKGISLAYASEGFRLAGADYKIACVYPGETESFSDINSMSAVYRFEYDEFSMLLTGDITKEAEERMMNAGKVAPVTVLKVAHHASNYSSCEEFLSAASPKYAIISCGVNNRYNHPGSDTVKRLESLGIPYMVTSESGAITIRPKGRKLEVRGYLE